MRENVSSGSPFESLFGFCRATRHGNVVAVAGTAPIGDDGKTVGVGDPEAQARRCFEIIVRALEQLGASAEDVIRTRMYLTRIDDWQVIGRVHGEVFGATQPVATMVGVSTLIDPDWVVEIEADAIIPSS